LNRQHRVHSVLNAEPQQGNAGGSIGKRRLAWMTDWDERKERKKMSEAKRRQTQFAFCRGFGHSRASSVRRTSIGVPPRFSSQGVFHRKGLSLGPGFLGRGGDNVLRIPLSGITRPGLEPSV